MRLFDLHCDTLYRARAERSSLSDSAFEINLEKAKAIQQYTQLAAVWIPDEIRGKAAVELFFDCVKIFENEGLRTDRHRMYLSVESGAALGGKLEHIKLLKRCDVKALTLTWNGENELGGGADTDLGLTDFGKAALPLLEDAGIVLDLSHSSERLFFDVIERAKKPIIATHSNAKAICSHRRNLSDEQFLLIKNSGGIVGLTFHNAFLNNDAKKASIDDLVRHADHFLSLGGEDALALGSDFDGGELPDDIRGLEDVQKIYDRFCRAFGDSISEKIFFTNAEKFFGFS